MLAAVSGTTLVPQVAHAQVTETALHDFTQGEGGSNPETTLLADTTGPGHTLRGLYGTTSLGGAFRCGFGYGCGTVFHLMPPMDGQTAWTDKTEWVFTDGSDGSFAWDLSAATRRIARDTPLYGTTNLGGGSGNGTVFAVTGRTLATLWSFTGGSDGANPTEGRVVIDGAGNLYASAQVGGANGGGTVIELTPPAAGQTVWTENTVWSFSGPNDGAFPFGLAIDKAGALYVTANGGGRNDNGAIVKLIPPAQGQTAWTERTLWRFQGGSDGAAPQGPVVVRPDGDLYGTTSNGGNPACNFGCGTVYRLTPPEPGETAWKEKVLWRFTGGADGANPRSEVILDRDGAVYGTAVDGGQEYGTVFKLQPPGSGQSAWTETTLWAFSGGRDGGTPLASLTPDASGILYGATAGGRLRNHCACGVVFSLTGTGYVP